jgi:hypothetical protein
MIPRGIEGGRTVVHGGGAAAGRTDEEEDDDKDDVEDDNTNVKDDDDDDDDDDDRFMGFLGSQCRTSEDGETTFFTPSPDPATLRANHSMGWLRWCVR